MPVNASEEAESAGQLEEVLTRAGARNRATLEKHLAACDAEPDPGHGKLWRRLAVKLATLAPMPVQTGGPQAVLFYVADGKYRMQVFALEDARDGSILLYMPDVTADAVSEKILAKNGSQFTVGGAKKIPIEILAMDSRNTPDPPAHVKHMIGWNRKAIRLTLEANKPTSPQVTAVEAMCALAESRWVAKPA
jgi:hypothetical protein